MSAFQDKFDEMTDDGQVKLSQERFLRMCTKVWKSVGGTDSASDSESSRSKSEEESEDIDCEDESDEEESEDESDEEESEEEELEMSSEVEEALDSIFDSWDVFEVDIAGKMAKSVLTKLVGKVDEDKKKINVSISAKKKQLIIKYKGNKKELDVSNLDKRMKLIHNYIMTVM